jgi:hypothetical protein
VRSLWRMIASRWLGGEASEALTGDSALLDLLMPAGGTQVRPSFEVKRLTEVSHRAMMSRHDPGPEHGEDAVAETVQNGPAE